MRTQRTLRSAIATVLAAAMFTVSMPVGVVRAKMVETGPVIDRMEVAARRAEISAFLARSDIRDQLATLGVPADEAAARVASLSDAEVLQIAQKIDELPAGQAGGVSLVVVLLLVIILILIV